MRVVEAETALAWSELLLAVDHGETVIVTRAGKPIAKITPDQTPLDDREAAIKGIKALRMRTKPVTTEELIAWKHEGHRY